MQLRTIKKIKNLKGKTVLCRIDLNVELVNGRPDEFSEFKIKQALPTVEWLLKKRARVVLLSHFGRPTGRDLKFSLRPFVNYLGKKLGHRPGFLHDIAGAAKIIKTSKARLFLLENLRFWKGEETNDIKFARDLAALGDIYVNEAFAVSHRAHASVSAITRLLPSYAGQLFLEEVKNLSKLLGRTKKPFVVLLGGAKISTKAPVIKNLLRRADYILLGGALAHPFLAAKRFCLGRSMIERGVTPLAKKLLNKKIILPIDALVINPINSKISQKNRSTDLVRSDQICTGRNCRLEVKDVEKIGSNDKIVDIGPATILRFSEFIKKAQTIVWNGPLGRFEQPEFSHGSVALARLIAARSRGKAYGVVGGGETLAVLARTGMQEYVDWVSTGGGAMLEFLSGKKLPGIKALLKSH